MSSPHETSRRLYTAFAERDGEAMAACYHPEARFSDPVFPGLSGDEVGSMWRMLCERAKDLDVTLVDSAAEGDRGEARWEARYTYSATGRPVHNVVRATFEFDGDLIRRHRDEFDLWRWTRMALGPVGWALGWSPVVRTKVRAGAADGLAKWRASRAAARS